MNPVIEVSADNFRRVLRNTADPSKTKLIYKHDANGMSKYIVFLDYATVYTEIKTDEAKSLSQELDVQPNYRAMVVPCISLTGFPDHRSESEN